MRTIRKRAVRSSLLTIAAIAAFAAIGAGSASAATALQVTTDTNQARQQTSLSVTTALTGSGTARKQYGAKINLPGALNLEMYYFGAYAQMCDAGSYSTVSTGLGNVQAFSNANCPATAKIGTATLGSTSGSIYAVDSSPLPTIAVYFDTGLANPYGRKIINTWDANGALSMDIKGLPNTSTSGLTLNFYNPGRAGGLSSKVFTWTEPGDTACIKHPVVTGSSYHWPSIVFPWSTYSTTPASNATLTLNGCDFDFLTGQDTTQAGDEVALSTFAGLFATGDKQYGQTFDLPESLWNNFPAWGGPVCSPSSFSVISTGYTPTAGGFTPTSCASGSIVGSATLGSQSGSIYLVSASPIPQFGVYFNSGVTTPYGRRLNIDWGPSGSGRPQLRIFGLNGAANAGLQLDFTPPVSGQPKMWHLAPSGSAECATDYAKSTIYTYPASGTVATANGPLTARNPIQVTGC